MSVRHAIPPVEAQARPVDASTPRRVLLVDLLGDAAPAAVTWVELDGGVLAAYHPGRLSYAEAVSVLRGELGPIDVTDARTGALQ